MKITKSKLKLNILLILLIMFSSVIISNAYSTNLQVLRYEMEEGGGNILIDSSGNSYHATRNGFNWDTNSKFGGYSIKFGGGDYAYTPNINLNNEITFNFWSKYNFGTHTNKRTIFNLHNANYDLKLQINPNSVPNLYDINLIYTDINNIIRTQNLLTGLNLNTNWNMETFTINNNSIKYYVNDILLINTSLNNNIKIDSNPKTLYIGIDYTLNNDYKGNIDEFRIFNFNLSTSQINDLKVYNNFTISNNNNNNPIINITNQTPTTIITSTTPLNNQSINNTKSIQVTTNHLATCDLYIDNDLIKSYSNIISFNYNLNALNEGTHNYFVYCEYFENTTRKYQISNTFNFNIVKPKKIVQFFLYDINSNLLSNYDDLYLVTPCNKNTQTSSYYVKEAPLYIQKLNNGNANFNLAYNGNYEFCLMKGKINYKENNYTLNYDFVDVTKKTLLGKLFVNNETFTYSLKVDNTDLYRISAPQFWGKTWSALFQMVVGILLGGLLILIGLIAENSKLTIVGGLVIAIGMGVSVTTFVGALI